MKTAKIKELIEERINERYFFMKTTRDRIIYITNTVDMDWFKMSVLKEYLEENGYRVDIAATVRTAFIMVEKRY